MLRRLASDQYLRDSAVSYVTAFSASFISYLFHPIIARLLSLQDYGDVQAALSLYGNLAIFLGIFSVAVVNIIANADGHDHSDQAERRRRVTVLRNVVNVFSAAVFGTLLACSGLVRDFFHFRSVATVMVLSFAFLSSAPLAFRRAFLRGNRRFFAAGTTSIVEYAARVVCAATLVIAGTGAAGAVAGIVLAQVAALAQATFITAKDFSYVKGAGITLDAGVRSELKYALLILAVSLSTSFLTTGDVLMVKRFFDATTAGAYAGVSMVANVVLYATGPAAAVITPYVKMKADENTNRRFLGKGIGLILLAGIVTSAIFISFPRFVISVFVGSKFLTQSSVFPALCLEMLLVSVVTPMLQYRLALRDKSAAVIGAAGVTLIFVLTAVHRATPGQIVSNFVVSAAAMLIALLLTHVFPRRWYAIP